MQAGLASGGASFGGALIRLHQTLSSAASCWALVCA